jgi:hypothetical protein
MLVRDLLRNLNLGSSVAEHDELLERHFVETETFRALAQGRVDVVAGDKGTGKSALYRILTKRYTTTPELRDVEIVSAFNPVGAPMFQRLSENATLGESDYKSLWKTFFLALAGNWILELADGDYTPKMVELDNILASANLRSPDDSASGVFTRILTALKRRLNIRTGEIRLKSGEVRGRIGPAELAGRVEFAVEPGVDEVAGVRHDDALRLLDGILDSSGITLWLTLDRLDEAFQESPELEKSALRALLRTYLDMQEFGRIRLKLFLRRDLFRRVSSGGFVNLTHVNSKKIEIIWDDADLFSLLYKRVAGNEAFLRDLGLKRGTPNEVFAALFPEKVDPGDRKPTTWTWILGRIRDGNGVKPPRNLIDLIIKSSEAQLRQEDRSAREYTPGVPLISSDSLKRGLEALSSERVEDTLLAEAGADLSEVIERFRRGKSEHNIKTLADLLGEDVDEKIKYLQNIGFLEKVGPSYKIPMLYRTGLEITQGKAFASTSLAQAEEDEGC